jgi:LPS sulfotransferase NodH/GT2 family glycosyltransferase
MTDERREHSSNVEAGTLPHTSYLICATERVGSYLLADALAGTGIAGRPAEYFHGSRVHALASAGSRADYERYLTEIIEAGTTQNGVWGGKIHWSHLEGFMREVRRVPDIQDVDAPTLLQSSFPNLRYIRLTRYDKVRQAVSLFKARRTGIWWQLNGSEQAQSRASEPELSFDFAAISYLLQQIEEHEAAWSRYFASCGVQPLLLTYEELPADLPAAVRHVLSFIGLDVPADYAIAAPRFVKQADEVSEEWVERFQRARQARSAASAGPAPPLRAIPWEDTGEHESAPIRVMGESARAPHISVVVVSHNEGEHLQCTVESLLASLPPTGEVVVVDDLSTDGSADGLKLRYRQVSIYRPQERLGVARGRNFGAHRARGEVLVFSDAHVDVPVNWSQPCLDTLTGPRIGVVAPAISAAGAPDQKGYGGYWADASSLRWRWGSWQGADPHPVPLVCGCFMAMRRETFDAVGGFDGGFVLWGQEDAELSIRLWTFGYTCLLVPTVAVSHLFRPTHPYHITWETVLHNMLRLAVVHFRQERIDRLLDHARSNGAFPAAWQRLTATDAWERRAVVQAARQFDDSWFFERFGMA